MYFKCIEPEYSDSSSRSDFYDLQPILDDIEIASTMWQEGSFIYGYES